MTVLLVPDPWAHEGPAGYRLRLAEANLMPQTWLDVDVYTLDGGGFVKSPMFQRWRALRAEGTARVNRRARWCSNCLEASASSRIGWELLFADACAACGYWLLDVCSACGEAVTWQRDTLLHCPCGAALARQPARAAPAALVRLSQTLEQLALGLTHCELSTLRGLSVAQSQRLVRVLGAYGGTRHQRAPQKISGADILDASWTVTTLAAEILDRWPAAFHQFLSRQGADSSSDAGRMQGVFGGFYRALYKGLKEPEFDWVRQAFEDFIAEHWVGALGRRNRCMPDAVLSRLAWMPGPEAARKIGVSGTRMQYLIDSGAVRAMKRVSAGGRTFVMVRREDIDSMSHEEVAPLTLAQAATQLGIKRQRLGRLLPTICPEAKKVTLQGTPWLIPRSWVEGWLSTIELLPICQKMPSGTVTLDHVLRYGPLGDEAVAQLLLDISTGAPTPHARSTAHQGVAGVIIDQREVSRRAQVAGANRMSVVQASEHLGVKQEVAYALIRLGLLEADETLLGRRTAATLSAEQLQRFHSNYVFASELARACGRSPKAVVAALAAEDVTEVAGPNRGNCRQVVYARTDVKSIAWLCIASLVHDFASDELTPEHRHFISGVRATHRFTDRA